MTIIQDRTLRGFLKISVSAWLSEGFCLTDVIIVNVSTVLVG